MAARCGSNGLKQVECADQIRFDVGFWIIDGIAHTSLRCEVDDDIGLFGPDQLHQNAVCLEPFVHRAELGVLQQHRLPTFFQRNIVIIGHRIEPDHLKPVIQKSLRQVKPDKSGRAGDQSLGHLFGLFFCGFKPLPANRNISLKARAFGVFHSVNVAQIGHARRFHVFGDAF